MCACRCLRDVGGAASVPRAARRCAQRGSCRVSRGCACLRNVGQVVDIEKNGERLDEGEQLRLDRARLVLPY
eukprot:3297766-Prymnesium_polylepis.1